MCIRDRSKLQLSHTAHDITKAKLRTQEQTVDRLRDENNRLREAREKEEQDRCRDNRVLVEQRDQVKAQIEQLTAELEKMKNELGQRRQDAFEQACKKLETWLEVPAEVERLKRELAKADDLAAGRHELASKADSPAPKELEALMWKYTHDNTLVMSRHADGKINECTGPLKRASWLAQLQNQSAEAALGKAAKDDGKRYELYVRGYRHWGESVPLTHATATEIADAFNKAFGYDEDAQVRPVEPKRWRVVVDGESGHGNVHDTREAAEAEAKRMRDAVSVDEVTE
jgi:hypothetical protein